MRRYISPPLVFEGDDATLVSVRTGADLVVYGVDHAGPSYEGRVFLNNPDANLSTPRSAEAGYAGSYTIFGHNGCYGDVGHCDVTELPADPFDVRATHPLAPVTILVDVTEGLARVQATEVVVTIVPVVPGEENKLGSDVLTLDRVRLVTYAS